MAMVENEQKLRMEVTRKKLELEEANSRRADEELRINKRNSLWSIISTLIIVLTFIAAVVLIIGYFQQYVQAAIFGFSGIVAIVYALIHGTRVKKP